MSKYDIFKSMSIDLGKRIPDETLNSWADRYEKVPDHKIHQFCENWLNTQSVVPTPKDIQQFLASNQDTIQFSDKYKPTKCRLGKCDGTGLIEMHMPNTKLAPYLAKCECCASNLPLKTFSEMMNEGYRITQYEMDRVL